MKRIRRAIGALALIPLVAIACTEGDTPAGPELALDAAADHTFQFSQHFIVCKNGSDATFSVEINAVAQPDLPVAEGTCEIVARWSGGDPNFDVTVTEQVPSGFALLGWERQAYFGNDKPAALTTGTSLDVSGLIGNDRGFVVTYTNVEVCTAEIGDFVWNDLDGDGLQDPGEPGIPGVTVNLYDAGGGLVGTAVTDANGFYLFGGLCAGDYTVDVDENTVPAGWIQTPTGVGGDPTIDNNPDPSSVNLPTNDASDLTIDFGFWAPPPPLGGEGCTPGYYKNLKQHLFAWTDAGYDPDQSVMSVFSEAANAPYAALGAATLHEGLSFQGGDSVEEKAEILLRAAIAAVLNASNPNVSYARTTAGIIADVNAALASQDKATILDLAGDLDFDNNAGCPLNNGK